MSTQASTPDVQARKAVVRRLKAFLWRTPFYPQLFRVRWRLRNQHNYLTAGKPFPLKSVRAGRGSYGVLNVWAWGAPNESLSIGHYVSIAEGTRFLLGGNHWTDHVSQYPFKWRILGAAGSEDCWSKGPILVEDDVWIGQCAIILSGVTLGQGCVVGAGSVVTKNVPPYAVAAGNPAKVIRYRFEGSALKKMERFRFEHVDDAFIRTHTDLLYAHPDAVDLCAVPFAGPD